MVVESAVDHRIPNPLRYGMDHGNPGGSRWAAMDSFTIGAVPKSGPAEILMCPPSASSPHTADNSPATAPAAREIPDVDMRLAKCKCKLLRYLHVLQVLRTLPFSSAPKRFCPATSAGIVRAFSTGFQCFSTGTGQPASQIGRPCSLSLTSLVPRFDSRSGVATEVEHIRLRRPLCIYQKSAARSK